MNIGMPLINIFSVNLCDYRIVGIETNTFYVFAIISITWNLAL